MNILNEILEKMENDPWYVKLKRSFTTWWAFQDVNKLARFRIWLHKRKLKEDTCKDCEFFIPFFLYIDEGDCYNERAPNENIVKIWHKCNKFKKR